MHAQVGSVFRGTFELDAAPFDWGKDYKRPNLAPEEVIVYEMGVRSFTADESSKLGPGQQGTYTGLMAKVSVIHLIPLPVNAPQCPSKLEPPNLCWLACSVC